MIEFPDYRPERHTRKYAVPQIETVHQFIMSVVIVILADLGSMLAVFIRLSIIKGRGQGSRTPGSSAFRDYFVFGDFIIIIFFVYVEGCSYKLKSSSRPGLK